MRRVERRLPAPFGGDHQRMRRFVALALWCLLVWVLLTWTATVEQAAFGIGVALVVAFALAPLGEVVKPWRLLSPRTLIRVVRLALFVLVQIVRANVVLAWRVWHRHPPIRTGLVVVPTRMTSDCGLTAVGLLSSLIVDNQIVDVDRGSHELLYHAVAVPEGTAADAYEEIIGPLERHLMGLTR
jgi:multicomponent Na+:H+ antiporter subunit E